MTIKNKNIGTFIASDPGEEHKIEAYITLVSDLDHYAFTHISEVYFNYASHPDLPPSLSIQPGRHLDHILVPYYFTPIDPARLTQEEYEQLMNDNEIENHIVPNEVLEELAELVDKNTAEIYKINNEIVALNKRIDEIEIPGNELIVDPTHWDNPFSILTSGRKYPRGIYEFSDDRQFGFGNKSIVTNYKISDDFFYQQYVLVDPELDAPNVYLRYWINTGNSGVWTPIIDLSKNGIFEYFNNRIEESNKRIDEYNEKELTINPFEIIDPSFNVNTPAHKYPTGMSMIAQTPQMGFPSDNSDPLQTGTIITFKTVNEEGLPTAFQIHHKGTNEPRPWVSNSWFRQYNLHNEWSDFIYLQTT